MVDEQRAQRLAHHYQLINKLVLSRQDPITGLLPASTAINAHGDYTDAWVRDNVYSILCVWGLSRAYERYAPDCFEAQQLNGSVIKLMRGLLFAMMRQSDRVEKFKISLKPIDALHAKYGTQTGLNVVGDDEWGHLQLDATSLYLLMLAQMIASGLKIVVSMDEVNFIQNLVHYISRTYCTPDFGIWERGNKINHGTTEINASSVGMAKAALEALDGFNLFGFSASQEAVLHVLTSDIARSRFTLQALLPRESTSKEIDAALLSIISYPAFAVESQDIVSQTLEKIEKKLVGAYGCKRFLLDGHQSVLEDVSRLHYEPSELRQFEGIESEWPLFFCYFLLHAIFTDDKEAIAHWRAKLQPLFVEVDGMALLPELYYVKEEDIAIEKANPGSAKRQANENIPLVWAQSLYSLGEMVLDGILRISDIDPLNRRLRLGHVRKSKPLVSVIAEDESVKQQLLDLGYTSESLQELAPIKVMHAAELSKVYQKIGVNEKLHLTGRPPLVARTITTSKFYILQNEEILFLPYYFNPKGFYFGYDNELLVEHFSSSLKFLEQHWDSAGQPIILFLVRKDMLDEQQNRTILELLGALQSGVYEGVKVTMAPLRQLQGYAAKERIDYLHGITLDSFDHFISNAKLCELMQTEKEHEVIAFSTVEWLEQQDDERLKEELQRSESKVLQAYILYILYKRHDDNVVLNVSGNEATLAQHASELYEAATICHHWAVVRRLAEVTNRFDDRLEDVLLDLIIRQKRLAVGRSYSDDATLSQPMDNLAVLHMIESYCGESTAESVLTQEVIRHLGHLIRNEPELFENLLTLRTWYFVQLLVGHISAKAHISMAEAYEQLLVEAPNSIYAMLRDILHTFAQQVEQLQHQENMSASGVEQMAINFSDDQSALTVEDWAQWRQQAGMIGHMGDNFYKDVWHMLQRCSALVIGDKYSIQSRLTHEMTLDATAGEHSFELRVDSLIQNITASNYRQLNIELLSTLTQIFRENQKMRIDDEIVLDVLIGHAVKRAWEQHHSHEHYNEARSKAWEYFYTLPLTATKAAYVDAFMFLISHQNKELSSY